MIWISIPLAILVFYLLIRIRRNHRHRRAFMQQRREHRMTTLIEGLREDRDKTEIIS